MKKALSLVLLVVTVIGVVGFTPAQRVTAVSASLAALMPADTFFFGEVRTSDVPGAVKTLQDVLTRANIPANLASEIDRVLSQGLGRTATLDKDISSWLGDRVGVGVYVPDATLEALFTRRSSPPEPEVYFVAAVKDEAAADAFLKDVFASIQKAGTTLTRGDDKIGDVPVVTYADKNVQVIARWKGYVALGTPSISRFINGLKAKNPTLDTDALYKKTTGMLKPDNFAVVYSRTPLSPVEYVVFLGLMGPTIGRVFENIVRSLEETPGALPTATPTPTPTPTPIPQLFDLIAAFTEMGATAMGFYGDDTKIAVDFAFYVNPDSLKQVFTILKVPADIQLTKPAPSISLDMAGRISNQAVGVILGSNVPQIVQNGLSLAKATAKFVDLMDGSGSSSSDSIDTAYSQLETGLQSMFDLNLNQDVLAWMGGEFAGYAAYYPHAAASSVPINYGVVVDTSDAARTEAALTKLNAGIAKAGGTAPSKTDDGLFIFGTGPSALGYGLIKNELLLNGGGELTAAANAVRGDGTLASDATWKQTAALLPAAYQHVWYVNMGQLSAALQATTSSTPSDQQMIALSSLFKSALLYSTDLGGGSSLTTLAVLVK